MLYTLLAGHAYSMRLFRHVAGEAAWHMRIVPTADEGRAYINSTKAARASINATGPLRFLLSLVALSCFFRCLESATYA